MVQVNFNANDYQPQYGGGGGLPAGRHKVVISDSSSKPTKDNTGGYLAFELQCIEGPLSGVKHVDRVNLWSTSQVAADIAKKQMSAYCHVTGVFQVADTSMMHNRPFFVEIAPQKDNPQYTEVVKLFDVNGNEPGKTGGGAPAQQGAAPSGPPPSGPPAAQPVGGGFTPPGAGAPPANGGGWSPPGGAPAHGAAPGGPPAGGGWAPPGGAPPAQPPAQGGGWTPPGGAPPAGGGGWGPPQ